MPARIISPDFSFVRFSDQHISREDWYNKQIPGAEIGFALPVNSPTDVAFQVFIETDTEAEADAICGIPAYSTGLVVAYGGDLEEGMTWQDLQNLPAGSTDFMANTFLGAHRYRVSDTQVMFYYPRIPDLRPDACGQCFQLVFLLDWHADTLQSPSNLFRNNCLDTDFTTVINYFSVRDEVGFLYCLGPNIKNRIRLPMYITRPTYPKDEEVLRQSDNKVRIRKSNIRKLYEVVTDNIPDWVVECINGIFVHDEVFIDEAPDVPQTLPYKGQVVIEGPIDPRYVDYKNYPLATLTFKLNAVDFNMLKNNCGLCSDYSSMVTTTDTNQNISPNSIYQIDLFPFFDADCCDPVSLAIDYYQANYIQDINLDYSSGIAGNNADLNFGTKASLTASAQYPPPLVRVRVTCGGVTEFINVTSDMA